MMTYMMNRRKIEVFRFHSPHVNGKEAALNSICSIEVISTCLSPHFLAGTQNFLGWMVNI